MGKVRPGREACQHEEKAMAHGGFSTPTPGIRVGSFVFVREAIGAVDQRMARSALQRFRSGDPGNFFESLKAAFHSISFVYAAQALLPLMEEYSCPQEQIQPLLLQIKIKLRDQSRTLTHLFIPLFAEAGEQEALLLVTVSLRDNSVEVFFPFFQEVQTEEEWKIKDTDRTVNKFVKDIAGSFEQRQAQQFLSYASHLPEDKGSYPGSIGILLLERSRLHLQSESIDEKGTPVLRKQVYSSLIARAEREIAQAEEEEKAFWKTLRESLEKSDARELLYKVDTLESLKDMEELCSEISKELERRKREFAKEKEERLEKKKRRDLEREDVEERMRTDRAAGRSVGQLEKKLDELVKQDVMLIQELANQLSLKDAQLDNLNSAKFTAYEIRSLIKQKSTLEKDLRTYKEEGKDPGIVGPDSSGENLPWSSKGEMEEWAKILQQAIPAL